MTLKLLTYRTFLFVLILLLVLSGCVTKHSQITPRVVDGFIDLSTWDFAHTVKLEGKWEFYWQTFQTENFRPDSLNYIEVPSIWNGHKLQQQKGGDGYATYRMRIKVNDLSKRYALKTMSISTSSVFYIDGERKFINGKIGTTANESTPSYRTGIISFTPKTNEIEIVVLVSNFFHRNGGIWETISFGEENALRREHQNIYFISFMLLGSIAIMMLYHLGLFVKQRHDMGPLFFALFCFCVLLRLLVSSEYLIYLFADLPWPFIIRLEYITLYVMPALFSVFLNSIMPRLMSRYPQNSILVLAVLSSVTTLFFKAKVFTYLVTPWQLITVLYALYGVVVLLRATIKKEKHAGVVLSGFLILVATVVLDILYQIGVYQTVGNLLAFGLFTFIFSQAYVLSVRFSDTFLQVKQLGYDLDYQNKNLEKLVATRTQKIEEQNKALLVSHKRITDSILYAKRIQKALIPTHIQLGKCFTESFILFKPRDVVSGDFYWAKDFNDYFVLVAADCTGHGVPGGFLSMLGISFLNEEVNENTLTANEPAAFILERLRNKVKQTFLTNESISEGYNGMDLSLCIYNKKSKQLHFSGANSSILIARKKSTDTDNTGLHKTWKNEHCTLFQLKGNPMPVGKHRREKPFDNIVFQLKANDSIYLYSDGLIDQLDEHGEQKLQIKRLRQFLMSTQDVNMDKQKARLYEFLNAWIGAGKQIDDVLVIGLRLA